jgi:hypothetical protein
MSYEYLFESWCVRLSLTVRHAIAQAKPHTILLCLYMGCCMHHSLDKHLACGDGMKLDCYGVIAITGDYNIVIITLDNLYYVLSCQSTPPKVPSVLYERRVNSGGTNALPGTYLHQEWASRRFGPRFLVGFRCENTYHMGTPDRSSSERWTCPWNLARGVPSTSFLEELTSGRDIGIVPDLSSCPVLT